MHVDSIPGGQSFCWYPQITPYNHRDCGIYIACLPTETATGYMLPNYLCTCTVCHLGPSPKDHLRRSQASDSCIFICGYKRMGFSSPQTFGCQLPEVPLMSRLEELPVLNGFQMIFKMDRVVECHFCSLSTSKFRARNIVQRAPTM